MSATRASRMGTLLVRMLLAIALLAALAAVALHWASRSDAVLRWAVAQIAQRLPGELTVTGMRGALARPVHIDRIEYVQGDLSVRAQDLDLEWSPSVLALGRRLWIRSLRVASVEVVLRPSGEPAKLPENLALPLPVSVDRFQVGTLRIARGDDPVELSGIDLAYDGDTRFHTLRLARLDSPWGSLDGQLQILTQRPFTLTASAGFRSAAWKDWPLSARAELSGTLSEIAAQGSAQVRDLPVVHAKAVVAPFEPVPLRAVQASVAGLDVARLAPQAPSTALDLQVSGAGTAFGGLAGRLQGTNRGSGPLDQDRLPLAAFEAAFEATPGQLFLRDATLDLGDQARARGEASLRPESIQAKLAVTALDLRRLHSALRSTALDGTVSVVRTDAGEQVELDLGQASLRVQARATRAADRLEVHELNARIADGSVVAKGHLALSGARAFNVQGRFTALDPAALGDFPSARITGRATANGQLSPTWQAAIAYALDGSRWRGQALSGQGRFTVSPQRVREVDARLALAANRVALRGAFGGSGETLQFKVQAPVLSAFRSDLAGELEAEGSVGGTLQRPALDATLSGRGLALPGGYRAQALTAKGRLESGDDPRVTASAKADGLAIGQLGLAGAQLDVDGTRSAHRIDVRVRRGALDVNTVLEGGASAALERWSGRVLAFELGGSDPLRLLAPAALSLSRSRLAFGPAEFAGEHGRLRLAESVLSEGRLSSSGTIESLRLARVLGLLEVKSPVQTDLVLGARWSLTADRQMNGRVELFRQSGDVTALIDDQSFALGLEQLAADIKVEANRVSGSALASGEHVDLAAKLETRLEQRGGRWGLPGTAPLSLDVRATVDSIKPIAALFTRAAQVDGNVSVTLAGRGTVADPRLSGNVQGSNLSVEQVGSGLYLTDGKLSARFERTRIRLEELTMQGGGGRLAARGEYDVPRAALALDWTAERLTAVQRPDLLLVATGGGSLTAGKERTQARGRLRMDRGRVELRETGTRALGDDVVVVGRKPPAALPERVVKSEVDFTLELGDDFRVSGRGLDARMVGQVRLTTPGNGPLRAQGEIKVAKGTFEIYGRKLDIDPGALYFAGPVDNPALDIRAMRRNQAVEAGVEITGTARNLQVRLVSVPEVPDMEKLSWLTLGRKLDTTNQSETEQMQRYGAALATTVGTGAFQARMARAVGLDEITVLPGTDASGEGGIVQLGKRVSDRVYLILEQRLSTAENIFKVNYQLSRDWSLRLESGETDALDIFYTLSFD